LEPVPLVVLGLHQVLDLLVFILVELRVVTLLDVILLVFDGLESEVTVAGKEATLLFFP
jgi:hypothetical protein